MTKSAVDNTTASEGRSRDQNPMSLEAAGADPPLGSRELTVAPRRFCPAPSPVLINTRLYLHARAAQWERRALALFPLCDVTVLNMTEHPGGGRGGILCFLHLSSPPLFSPGAPPGGAEVTFLRPSPRQAPRWASLLLWPCFCLSFFVASLLLSSSSQPSASSSSFLSPPTVTLPLLFPTVWQQCLMLRNVERSLI